MSGIVNLDAHERRAGLSVVLLGVLELDDVITLTQNVIEEVAQRPRLLWEGHEEVVAQPLVHERALHNIVVAGHIVVPAGDHARDRARG